MSEQPCDNFQEHDPLYNRHECPDCLGVRRIRALGNGVVPAQAREAFERLMGIK